MNDSCFLKRLNRYVDLDVSKTDLYLIDLTQLCEDQPSHSSNFDNVSVHDGLITESRGNDSSKEGHERISSHSSHALFIVPKSSFVHNMPMSATATQSLRLIVIPTCYLVAFQQTCRIK